ncbi:MAG: methyltransferase [Sphingobium sp.]|nr:methyltransferase [Sphingobium sp.]
MFEPMPRVVAEDVAPARTDVPPDLGAFAAEFLKAPVAVASPFPSSRSMVRRLLGGLAWDRIQLFVEFGPGTGAFTRYALGRMRRDARLLAIDTEPGFTTHLRQSIRDPRLVAMTGSALDVVDLVNGEGASRADCILSGLPFSTLREADRDRIVRCSAALLQGSGTFLAYQVRRAIEPHLRDAFARVHRQRHWLNLPPCHLYHAS